MVTLVGCVTLQEPVCLVTALVAHGNLRDYLNYIRAKVNSSSDIKPTSLGALCFSGSMQVCVCVCVCVRSWINAYRRTGFNCDNLLIANCEFLLCLQLLETQSHPIYSIPHKPCEKPTQSINSQFRLQMTKRNH